MNQGIETQRCSDLPKVTQPVRDRVSTDFKSFITNSINAGPRRKEYRMPSPCSQGNVERPQMPMGSRAEASVRRVPGACRGAHSQCCLPWAAMERSCSFAVGLLPPGRSVFVLALSEKAWAGSLPRGLALARHSCRLDTMILTQIPHT